ncbi:Uncharacterised protein [Flavonifractor plautii]|uniref:Uncharacterized protein n=1 Tax=Flavonifractor plautii TaxID=292800 RepID=A0A174V0S8_FLAPL|nr:Uncharacterised protein [Flavonifractor plautii]
MANSVRRSSAPNRWEAVPEQKLRTSTHRMPARAATAIQPPSSRTRPSSPVRTPSSIIRAIRVGSSSSQLASSRTNRRAVRQYQR